VHRYRGSENGPGLVSVEVRRRSESSWDNGQCEPANRVLVDGWRSAGNRNVREKENILAHKRTVSMPNVPRAGEKVEGCLPFQMEGMTDLHDLLKTTPTPCLCHCDGGVTQSPRVVWRREFWCPEAG